MTEAEDKALRLQAALDGTNEIGLAVLATTLSIVAVFLPVGLMGGIPGQFFRQFAVTISAAADEESMNHRPGPLGASALSILWA